ncbi:MAG: magnesium/cobalt transporter CorA [Candidatus Eremiobacterota bacterium]
MARKTRKRKKSLEPWVPAGTIIADPHAPKPVMDVIAFGGSGFVEQRIDDVAWLEQNKDRYSVLWLNVDGLGDANTVAAIGNLFGLHRLAMEDVVSVHQRAKVDIYDEYLFVVMRMLQREGDRMDTEQLSLFLGKNFVITFQEGIPGDCLQPVRNRLHHEQARVRNLGADFLAYNLLDAVIDAYFPILEGLGEELEDLENVVLVEPTRQTMRRIHDIKRNLLTVRRAVWPLREAITPLFREDLTLVTPETRVYLRDCYDHCVQVIDLVETFRELGSSLMDVYLSSVSNKMNEVMKVLTIITTIFVPMTFIAGIYGMNFNTDISPLNMPELNSYWGYPICVAVMLLLAAGELAVFYKMGWLSRSDALDLAPHPPSRELHPAPPGHATAPEGTTVP